ncbi:hypothetical protein IV102_27080 [bacterium]|nr:hypothetical protein [bacterium]
MATGINFNPASFRGQEIARRGPANPVKSETPGPVDGYQPAAEAPPTAPGVTFTVSTQQLATAAIQQTLTTLTSSGIPVSVVISQAASAQPTVSREEFQELGGEVRTLSRQVNQLQSQVENLAKPKPPTYGGD